MQKKREICEYRDKLDKTLSSPELTNYDSIKSLLRNQLSSSQECNENILEKRTADVSKLLAKLRSVSSITDHQVSKLTNDSSSYGDWKLKQDHDDCRVMYREGLEGSPFHTLLAEGYMDGPIQDCLCVSWESTLYKKWWPQFAFPPFRILKSTCLKKVGVGEQICLARMKVPWPLMDREIILHYFLFEYFKDGLVIILMNSISDLGSIGVSPEETENIIPESPDAVRIDLVGGFALQKVTPERSYFRTIADLDIKLDFVPPSLINFISRQLIGNGFRLYKKSVASVAKFDEDYSRALADPLYIKIRRALYDQTVVEEPKLETNEVDVAGSPPMNKHGTNGDTSENQHVHYTRTVPEIEEEPKLETNGMDVGSPPMNKQGSNGDSSENEHVHYTRTVPEIEEEEEDFEESVSSEDGNVTSMTRVDINRRFCISPEVEQALGTLERVIYMVRNITPVQEAEELSPNRVEDQVKQVSFLEHIENVPQKPEMQEFLTSTTTQETSDYSQEEKERRKKHDDILKKGKNSGLQRKRKARCFAFRSWL